MTEQLTRFGRYLADTGTKQSWLAEQLGVSGSKVCRWATGWTGMRETDQALVLAALRARAELSLDGLFDDLPEFHDARATGRTRARPRAHVGHSPFEEFLEDGVNG